MQAAIGDIAIRSLRKKPGGRCFTKELNPISSSDSHPEHVRLRLEAIGHLRENRRSQAAECLAQAAEATPTISGQFNDQPFDSLRDCDDLFGGVLEVFAQGSYFWIPLELVEIVAISPPKFPRDLLWVPARVETHGSESGQVFLRPSIPTRIFTPTTRSGWAA